LPPEPQPGAHGGTHIHMQADSEPSKGKLIIPRRNPSRGIQQNGGVMKLCSLLNMAAI